jgi:hypothetical protein
VTPRRIACLAVALLAGCAIRPERPPEPVVHLPAGERIAPARMAEAVTAGRSTRDEVRAALGAATVVRFDSGYEVWVYRFDARAATAPGTSRMKDDRGQATGEFVVLFAPSGIAAKARVVPYPARAH